MSIVERIKATAQKQNLSLTQLEKQLGFGTRTIYKWDKNSPSVDKVLAVANFLNVSLSWLATGQPESRPDSIQALYDQLSPTDQQRIRHYMDICLADDSPLSPSASVPLRLAILGRTSSPRSASGFPLPFHYVTSSVQADFVLVCGDTDMEPVFYKEEQLFIQNSRQLASGEIGIFLHQNTLLCRQYLIQPSGTILLQAFSDSVPALAYDTSAGQTPQILGRVILTSQQADRRSISFFCL